MYIVLVFKTYLCSFHFDLLTTNCFTHTYVESYLKKSTAIIGGWNDTVDSMYCSSDDTIDPMYNNSNDSVDSMHCM